MNDNKPDQTGASNRQSSSITIQDVARAIFDHVTIFNNLVTGLRVFGSTVVFQGRPSIFCNNSGIAGGGMALYGSSYIVVSPQIEIVVNFTANHASYGGGLYVDQPILSGSANCFFQTTSTQESDNPVNATILLSMQEYC